MISCIVLAGGKSERMGRDKRSLEMAGKPFLKHALEAASSFSDDVILSLASRDQISGLDLNADKIAIDEAPHSGPLGGLIASLKLCAHKYTAVVPCDSPLLKPGVFRLMAEKASGYDAVVPRKGERLEPLHAVYKVASMLSASEEAFSEGQLEVSKAVARLKRVRYMSVDDFKSLDQGLLTFFNVNYPSDLTELNELTQDGKR